MRSKVGLAAIAAAIGAFLAGPAAAQDLGQFAGMLATAAEGFGQGVGDAASAGPSVYVTATGQVKLPAPLTEAYLMNLQGKSKSAMEAAAVRDRQLESAGAIAKTFGVDMQVGASTFARQVDQEAQQAQMAAQQAAEAAAATAAGRRPARIGIAVGVGAPEPMAFVAVTGVRFQAADPKRLPAFLDALQKAGIEGEQSGTLGVGTPSIFSNATQVLGFGRLATVDDAIWDEASTAAIAAARRQATILASAAGRKLGEARQILLLSRSAQGDEARVTVAVRFGYLPGQ